MNIHLEYVAMLALPKVRSGESVDLPAGSTVTDLLNRLQLSSAHQRIVAVFVQDQRVHASRPLKDGDRIFLSLPIGGG